MSQYAFAHSCVKAFVSRVYIHFSFGENKTKGSGKDAFYLAPFFRTLCKVMLISMACNA